MLWRATGDRILRACQVLALQVGGGVPPTWAASLAQAADGSGCPCHIATVTMHGYMGRM